MTFGTLCRTRLKILQPFLKGECVWDLGCGYTRGHTNLLLKVGVSELHLLDKTPIKGHSDSRVNLHPGTQFVDMKPLEEKDVAFLSWPCPNCSFGLSEAVKEAKTVIYIGRNDDYTVCGDEDLWSTMVRREPVVTHEGQRDVMIVYSKQPRTLDLHLEEKNGIRAACWSSNP